MGILEDLAPVLPIAGGLAGAYFGGPAGAAAGGGIGGMMSGFIGGAATNAANSSMNAETRDWQDRMRRTNHQAEVEDLVKAGLNPILSVNAGASAPSSSNIAMQNPAANMASQALEIANTVQQMKQSSANIELTKAQTDKAAMETKRMRSDATKSDYLDRLMKLGEPAIKTIEEAFTSNAKKAPAVRGYNPSTKQFKMDKP